MTEEFDNATIEPVLRKYWNETTGVLLSGTYV